MKVAFDTGGAFGEAEYNTSDEEYSWSYDGDEQEIIEALSDLEDGKVYTDWDTEAVDSDDETDELIINEDLVYVSWERQIERLAHTLRHHNAEILYLGE